MKFLSHISRSVALIARDSHVLSFQGIPRLAMVKLGITRKMPTGGAMTVLAIVPEFSLMDISMATGTVVVQDPNHLHITLAPVGSTVGQSRVALRAQNVNMLTGQRVFGLRVVKSSGRLPARRCVAITADRRDLAPVFIEMATGARLVQTEKRTAECHLIGCQTTLVSDVLFHVALAAVDSRMLAVERIPGQGMIEILLAILPVHQIVSSSLMFHMAALALRVLLGSMQTVVVLEFILDDRMAGKTLVRDKLASGAMALAAILYSLKKGVSLMQFPGGDLSHRRQTGRHNHT